MNFFLIFIAICLFIILFVIYYLSRDDLIFLRKDLSTEKIFNIAFLAFFAGLFFSRLFYAAFYSLKMFTNPLVFFLFPYFPGLVFSGGIVGGSLFLVFYSRLKNLPLGRIFDYFSISTLCSLPIGYLGYFILSGKTLMSFVPVFIVLSYVVLVYVFFKFLYRYIQKGVIKDGSAGLIFLVLFSSVSLIANIFLSFKNMIFLKDPNNFLLSLTLLVSLVLFIRQERIIRFARR